MKPICSGGKSVCVEPVAFWQLPDGNVRAASNLGWVDFQLPAEMTFAQFMADYAACTAPIYFID